MSASGESGTAVSVTGASKQFAPLVALGDRIAAALGGSVERRSVRAVDDVSLEIARGETLGLVGESGCGKSTLGRLVAGILPPSAGTIRICGEPVMSQGRRPRKLTTRVQTIFQDPYASLDPRMRIGTIVAEGPVHHGLVASADAAAYAARWLAKVGLDPDAVPRYPHQFSGGQRQRIAIARALAMQPEVLVCDEPVASLDVSIQAQVLNLLLQLRRELKLTMLFISHHLGVVRHVSDRVAIMYLGRIVEIGPAETVYARPQHPYTQALLASVPQLVLDGDAPGSFRPIAGELPSPLSPPPGCHFHQRCPVALPRCSIESPQLRDAGPGQAAACHLVASR
ncbi:MAG: ATP-binding cassette domain-containing protein [Alphaproteobacteria bacterium]|nr:ATP-binding cassette domain-containing protein [Alphaproteobacteria bacterium]